MLIRCYFDLDVDPDLFLHRITNKTRDGFLDYYLNGTMKPVILERNRSELLVALDPSKRLLSFCN